MVRGKVRKAFEVSAKTAPTVVRDVDAALVEVGRALADHVDRAVLNGDPTETTKAMYLLPHMVNVLREMQATPASRQAVSKAATPPAQPSKLDELRAARGRAG